MDSYVYREAELANSSDKDLLAGPITVYLDGRFVGRGEIPTVARGQSFVVGFGADPQLRARRALCSRRQEQGEAVGCPYGIRYGQRRTHDQSW